MAGYDDEVSGPFLGRTDNRLSRRAGPHKMQRRSWQRKEFMEPREQSPAVLLGLRDQFLWRNSRIADVAGVIDMNERHVRAKRTGKLGAEFARADRDRLPVYCYENFAKTH
jgi:hypothetical protein